MKIKVTMQIDLADTGYNPESIKDLRCTIQNFGSLLHDWHRYHLEKQFHDISSQKLDMAIQEAVKKVRKDDLRITEQAFDNLRIEGKLDGKKVVFTHKKPYKETFTVDGRPLED